MTGAVQLDNATVYEVVRDMAARFERSSKDFPAEVNFKPVTTTICFAVLGKPLCVPIDEIAEVLEPPRFTRLPSVKDWLSGIASVRGKLLPIIDFSLFLGASPGGVSKQQRVLVLEQQGISVGLLVDNVRGLRHFNVDSFQSDKSELPETLKRYVMGCFIDNSSATYLFSPAQLMADQSFRDVAA